MLHFKDYFIQTENWIGNAISEMKDYLPLFSGNLAVRKAKSPIAFLQSSQFGLSEKSSLEGKSYMTFLLI